MTLQWPYPRHLYLEPEPGTEYWTASLLVPTANAMINSHRWVETPVHRDSLLGFLDDWKHDPPKAVEKWWGITIPIRELDLVAPLPGLETPPAPPAEPILAGVSAEDLGL